MGTQCDRYSSVARSLRAAAVSAALLFSASCGETGLVVPEAGPGRATAALRPNFATLPSGAPTVPLSKIQAVLTGPNVDKLTVEAKFVDGVATLEFDVPIIGASATFLLQYTAFDLQGVVAFTGTQTLVLRRGRNTSVPSPTLVYDGPDAKITALRITPGPLTLQAGTAAALAVTGTLPNGQTLVPRVSWTSSNPNIVAVGPDGALTAGRSQGTATITATSATMTATTQVKVQAPVDKVTLAPATPTIIRGQTLNTTIDLRDATNAVIDDRTPVYTSADPTVATVSLTGVISGVKVGKTTITATAEGKTSTVTVTIVSPLDKIDLGTGPIAFSSLKSTTTLTPKLTAVAGASVAGIVPEFSSSNASVASVDAAGVVTAVGNGTARITASFEGVTSVIDVVVDQVAQTVVISPRGASVTAIGESRTFTTAIADAGNSAIEKPIVTWTSSDPTVATVSGNGATGVVTALKPGSVTITATANGKTDAVSFVVAPVGRFLVLSLSRNSIETGQTSVVSAQIADGNGSPIGSTSATFTTSTPNVISVSGNTVTGLSAGTGRIVATSGSFSGAINVTVTGPPPPPPPTDGLTLTPASVEKLPGGTQQFSVSGGAGTYTWSVNGIPNGNSTYGTVTASGFYTAPSAVPSPSTFPVCAAQASPALSGCATVVISPIPSGGADVIVMNDMNLWDNNNGFGQGGANQGRFVVNLMNFSGSGPRTTQTGFMFYRGHGSLCASSECSVSSTSRMSDTLRAHGYTVIDNSSATLTGPIAANVKAILLLTPSTPFSDTEINILKQFAAEGGRIIFSGEHGGYYGSYVGPVENAFFAKMGGQLTNTNAIVACSGSWVIPQSSIRPHQVTAGLTGVAIPCASGINLGPNDYALFYDALGTTVVGAVAKIDLTPIPIAQQPAEASASRSVRPVPAGLLPTVDGVNRKRPNY